MSAILEQMQALILAGGLGTRLRAVVDDRPKSMADAGDKPFLEHQLLFLKRQGIRRFIFCVGYKYRDIERHFGDGSAWDVNITYSIEELPLGTGGALKHAESHVEGPFLALNGDSYFDADLTDLVRFHQAKQRMARAYLGTIALTRVRRANRYGSVRLATDDAILTFAEKSAPPGAKDAYVNAGIYLLQPQIFSHMPPATKISIERETFPALTAHDGSLFGCYLDGFFVDIGTPEGYRRFQEYLKEQTT